MSTVICGMMTALSPIDQTHGSTHRVQEQTKFFIHGLPSPLSFLPSLFSFLFFFFFSGTEMGTRTGYIPAKFPIIKPYPSLFLVFLLDLDVF